MADSPLGRWEAITPAEVTALLAGLSAPWWIAGGYAIEAFVGKSFRPHDDVDAGLFRDDQLTIQRHLAGWELHAADPPGALRPWRTGEQLPAGVHDIWARRGPDDPWRFQLMLNESNGDEWLFRRDERIRRTIQSLTWLKDGVPHLAPEIQLLFKSKAPRPKDEADFEAALPLLEQRHKAWLRNALELVEPGNPWLARLTSTPRIR